MQTERLDHRRTLPEVRCHLLIAVPGEQFPVCNQRFYLTERLLRLLSPVLSGKSCKNLLIAAESPVFPHLPRVHSAVQLYDLIRDVIHHVNRTAVYVENNIIAVIPVLMNHDNCSSLSVFSENLYICLSIVLNRPEMPGTFFFPIKRTNDRSLCGRSFADVSIHDKTFFICSHSSGFPQCRTSCRQTGRMSGTRRSRLSSWIPLNLWLSMF